MIHLLPEPRQLVELEGTTDEFTSIRLWHRQDSEPAADVLEIAGLRFWNYPEICIFQGESVKEGEISICLIPTLEEFEVDDNDRELFLTQGYVLEIRQDGIFLHYENKEGFIHGITSVKQLIAGGVKDGFLLPCCRIMDYPLIPVRAVAQTFSWYAGYGRLGFDSQLWGYEEWVQYLNICLDNKINQLNLVLYGYWPFDLPGYEETVFQNVPVKIWNAENRRWLTIRYSHPNLEEPFLERFTALAHKLGVKIFAYAGLNSYNGAYTIKHPQARMKPPETGEFLNDFDSLCLSYPGTVDYILESMRQIARIGFDGFTLEESEEGFWFCECETCKKRWHEGTASPGEAKHKANMWLLNQIYTAVREINPNAVIGIRAFRQPPLEKDPEFLKACAGSMPEDIMLFWAPGLYVPEGEFTKWCEVFGRDRIWGRDTEANSITSTMGRLYRTFKSNIIRYEDEANVQVIETDIQQHRGSAKMRVHGINGFMFEWYGLCMHLFAHGNYGWGSQMEEEEFYKLACEINFGDLGDTVLYVMKNMVTIHESQIPLYTTPFPFQKNKMTQSDIPAILAAKENHENLLGKIRYLQEQARQNPKLRCWLPHFDKWENAQRRNAVIIEMVLKALAYEEEEQPAKRDKLLDEILYLDELDFDIAKEMFFDVNPVGETGVKSCMFPYHEIKRLIHNIRHPEAPDADIICSGVEALGWLWL